MNKLPPPCPARVSHAGAAQHPQGRRAALWLLLGAGAAASAHAVTALPASLPNNLAAEVQRLAGEAAALVSPTSAKPPRVEVLVGQLDPRLALAPCQQIEPFLPPGARPLGRFRMGLRCAKGATAWRVTVPVVVKLWAPSLVARTALPTGTVLQAQHLATAEVDLAERPDLAIGPYMAAIGRTLARGLAPGEALRVGDLKLRQYFSSGDTVRVIAVGAGFSVSGEGLALGPGNEGRSIQVRLEGGRVISGIATGERRVEVAL